MTAGLTYCKCTIGGRSDIITTYDRDAILPQASSAITSYSYLTFPFSSTRWMTISLKAEPQLSMMETILDPAPLISYSSEVINNVSLAISITGAIVSLI